MEDNNPAHIIENELLYEILNPNFTTHDATHDATHDTISIATNDITSDVENNTKYQQSPIIGQPRLYKQNVDLQNKYNILQFNYDTLKDCNNVVADNKHTNNIYKTLQDNYDDLLADKENTEIDYKNMENQYENIKNQYENMEIDFKSIEIDLKIIKTKLDKTDKKLANANKDLQFCKETYNDDLVKKNDQLQKLQEKIDVLQEQKEINDNNEKDLTLQEKKNKDKFNQKIDVKLQQRIICTEIAKRIKDLADSRKSPSMQQRPVTQLVLQRNAEISAANFNKTWSTDERDIILRKKNATIRAYVQQQLYDAYKLHEETIDAIKKFWEKNQSLEYLQIEDVTFTGEDHELSIFENVITNL